MYNFSHVIRNGDFWKILNHLYNANHSDLTKCSLTIYILGATSNG